MPGAISKEFIFNNNAGDIYHLLTDIIDYIERSGSVEEHTISKLKMVLVELLTNSLKHSGGDKSIMLITLSPDEITIRKTDTGNALAIKQEDGRLQWPLSPQQEFAAEIEVYRDLSCTLKARLNGACRVQFFIEEFEAYQMPDLSKLTEHFGFMILARACNSFEYEFDITNGTNNFTVALGKK